jgi:hypothetical protein
MAVEGTIAATRRQEAMISSFSLFKDTTLRDGRWEEMGVR